MPQALIRSTNKNPVQEVQSLALDANDNYFLRWTDESDSSWYSKLAIFASLSRRCYLLDMEVILG